MAQPASDPVILGESLRRGQSCAGHLPFLETAIREAAGALARKIRRYLADARSGRDHIVPPALLRSGRLSNRTKQPAGSSTEARSWLSSAQEIRWRQCRGCASYTYHSDARPNLLKLSESLLRATEPFLCLSPLPESPGGLPEPPAVKNSSSGTIAFKCMGKKNACAHQAHQCRNCLDHRTNPLRPCHPQNDCSVAQSKRFTGWNHRSVGSDDLMQQIV